jgi:hypothetical protein
MSEGNAIRVIETQPEAAAIEIPDEVGRDRKVDGRHACRIQKAGCFCLSAFAR